MTVCLSCKWEPLVAGSLFQKRSRLAKADVTEADRSTLDTDHSRSVYDPGLACAFVRGIGRYVQKKL
jgi:hypothetical protein